jgi:hypothetical protein
LSAALNGCRLVSGAARYVLPDTKSGHLMLDYMRYTLKIFAKFFPVTAFNQEQTKSSSEPHSRPWQLKAFNFEKLTFGRTD